MKKYSPIESILTIVVGFIFLFYLFEYKLFLIVSFMIGVTGLISKTLTRYIHQLWIGTLSIIGKINSQILLGFLFYLLLTPIAILYRQTRKYATNKKLSDSGFVERNYEFSKKDFEELF